MSSYACLTRIPMWQYFNICEVFGFKFAFTYRIVEWFSLERTFKGHLVQPPCHRQEHLPLD